MVDHLGTNAYVVTFGEPFSRDLGWVSWIEGPSYPSLVIPLPLPMFDIVGNYEYIYIPIRTSLFGCHFNKISNCINLCQSRINYLLLFLQ